MKGYRLVTPEAYTGNPFTVIGKEWLIVAAGTPQRHNGMTASWGNMGVFWGKPAVTVYIRPTRYTKEFVDGSDLFTLSVFSEDYRPALNLFGTKSGRDCDKDGEAHLTPLAVDGTVAYAEAKTVFVCRKLAHADLDPARFDDPSADGKWYPKKDYHTAYIAEILAIYEKE